MKRFVFIALICMGLVGCAQEAEKPRRVTNNNFKVEVLFTDENGFTVHRFEDGGHYRYYVTPTGETITSNTTQSGKVRTSHPTTIPTVQK